MKNIEHIRHTLAHLTAQAVLEHYPKALPTIGPAVENGWYYDFDFGEEKITDNDLAKIQATMEKNLPKWTEFKKDEVTAEKALEQFKTNSYKSELISDFSKDSKVLTFYTCGGFLDLCKGGHAENPSVEIALGSFKLEKIAGAYWKGDASKKMLTRIYGLAFETKEELEKYIWQQEEAKKRDHRRLGKELGFFIFSDLIGAGLPLWTPRGTIIREELQDFVWQLRKERGYGKVVIPHITKQGLYEKSGHWAKYAEDLFKINTRDGHIFAMKPMNCPHHTQIYDSEPRSYRDLPQRYAESTMVYRDEQTGELSGLSRVISITQDDAHIFCRMNQIEQEAKNIWDIIQIFYSKFGFKMTPRLSRRDTNTPENYLGNSENWDFAESQLRNVIKNNYGSDYLDGPGEAAFYGPKIDFMAYDAIGRKHQIATIQLDLVQPSKERFDLTCTNEKGEKENIAMFHCAIMGSFERFLSIAIEHFAGAFPVWLSPVQVVVVPVKPDLHNQFAERVVDALKAKNVRVQLDDRNESLGKRIRAAKEMKVPYVIVVGDKEKTSEKLTIETRKDKIENISVEDFVAKVEDDIKNRSLN
jgi:threonyl-tRNA synthetase